MSLPCVHEGKGVTEPMLAVSMALFSSNTGLPPRTQSVGNLLLCGSRSSVLSLPTNWGSPGQGSSPFLRIAPPGPGDPGTLLAVPADCSL